MGRLVARAEVGSELNRWPSAGVWVACVWVARVWVARVLEPLCVQSKGLLGRLGYQGDVGGVDLRVLRAGKKRRRLVFDRVGVLAVASGAWWSPGGGAPGWREQLVGVG
jgi:hypothetical protein